MIRILILAALACLLAGCGITPEVRRSFQKLAASQQIVGAAYLLDLQSVNDQLLASKLRGKLIADSSPQAIDKALKQDAELRTVYRAGYARIRETLAAMAVYAANIELVLAKLERQKREADGLVEKGVGLASGLLKGAATGGVR